jgi:hypothetical protein
MVHRGSCPGDERHPLTYVGLGRFQHGMVSVSRDIMRGTDEAEITPGTCFEELLVSICRPYGCAGDVDEEIRAALKARRGRADSEGLGYTSHPPLLITAPLLANHRTLPSFLANHRTLPIAVVLIIAPSRYPSC